MIYSGKFLRLLNDSLHNKAELYSEDFTFTIRNKFPEVDELLDFLLLSPNYNKVDLTAYCKKYIKNHKKITFTMIMECIFYLEREIFNLRFSSAVAVEVISFIQGNLCYMIESVYGRKKVGKVKYSDYITKLCQEVFEIKANALIPLARNVALKNVPSESHPLFAQTLSSIEDTSDLFNYLKSFAFDEESSTIMKDAENILQRCTGEQLAFRLGYFCPFIERKISEILIENPKELRSIKERVEISIIGSMCIYNYDFCKSFRKRKDLAVLRTHGTHIKTTQFEYDLYEKHYKGDYYIAIIVYYEFFEVENDNKISIPYYTIINVTKGIGIGENSLPNEVILSLYDLYDMYDIIPSELGNVFTLMYQDFDTGELKILTDTMDIEEKDKIKRKDLKYEVTSPSWWKYKDLDYSSRTKNKNKTSKSYNNQYRHVSAFIRKMPLGEKGNRRSDAEILAEKYQIELKPGYTIVEEYEWK